MPFPLTTRVVCAVTALCTTSFYTPPSRPASLDMRADSAATAMIVEELHGFYRDLHDHNATSMVTHFYPAKVTARFAVPATDSVWAALAAPAEIRVANSDSHDFCMPHSAIAIVGNWARVRSRRCTGEIDEAWLYRMSSRWKIVHLELGATLTT